MNRSESPSRDDDPGTVSTIGRSAAVSLALLAACIHVPRIPAQPRAAGQQYDLAVALEVICTGHDWTTSSKLGSGVLVDGRHALTAAHVVACPFLPVVRMTLTNGESYRMAVEWEATEKDLARLVIASAEVLRIVPPVIGKPDVDDTVCAAVAFPARQMNCGVIEAVSSWPKSNVAMTAMTQPGNSGGGVYNARGELVGIVSSLSKDQLTGYATRVAGTGAMP